MEHYHSRTLLSFAHTIDFRAGDYFFLFYSILYQQVIGVLWCYVAVIAFYFMLPEKKAWVANGAMFLVIFPAMWNTIEHPLAIRGMMTLLGVSFFSIVFVRVINEQQNKLKTLAMIDPLTKVFNRTTLGKTLEEAIRQNDRTGVPMTLAALDLDHFKKVNDTFGHDAGDDVLRGVGEILRETKSQGR